MNKKGHVVLLATLAMVLVGCGNKESDTFAISGNDYIPDTYTGKTTYNALLGVPLKYLNNAITMQAEDGEHISNFVDGLIDNDEYGRLSKALAEKVTVNPDHDEYKFTLKSGIKWITSTGEQYKANINGKKKAQYVTADDFVFSIKKALDFRNDSQSYYLPAMFLENGYEYYCYTYALDLRDTGKDTTVLGFKISSDATLAVATNMIGNLVFNKNLGVTAAQIPAINNFSRVGARASEEGGKSVVTFKLQNPSYFFLSVLTYSAFLPINEAFVNEVGFNNFGYSKDDFLYNGAFYCTSWSENEVVYRKNDSYWDAEHIYLKNVNYKVINNSISNDFVRKEYEAGRIDAFGISQKDTVGWKEYVEGPDGTGTLEDPASDLAYSREIETVDSTFMFQLNVSRNASNEQSIKSGATTLEPRELTNTDNALKINAVRDLVLNGIDAKVYNERWGDTAELKDQYQMWTYVPKGFVQSNTGEDYLEYVYRAYQQKFGGTVEDAKNLLKQGVVQNTSAEHTVKTRALATSAKNAITAVNADGGVITYNKTNRYDHTNKAQVNYPIKIEYLGIPDDEQKAYDAAWMEKFNEDANVCTTNSTHVTSELPACANNTYPYFEIVTNSKVTLNTYTDMGESGQYHLYISGWGADYADPLTYMNTFVTGGDMANYTGTNEKVIDYKVGSTGTVTKGDLLTAYDSLVADGSEIYDNDDNRFTYFGQAEVELLFGVNIIRPLYMQGQGWSVSVSKAAGYEKPTAAYGLSSYKLKGVYVLTEPLTALERKAAKTLYNTRKAAALADDTYDIYG